MIGCLECVLLSIQVPRKMSLFQRGGFPRAGSFALLRIQRLELLQLMLLTLELGLGLKDGGGIDVADLH